MKFTPLIFIGILAGLGATDDIPQPLKISEWALFSASRTINLNGTTCDWSLKIRDEQNGLPAEQCNFTVKADHNKPCDMVQFEDIPCSAESDWVMNGGYSTYDDFMVFIVVNVREEAKAWFGFKAKALNNGDLIPKQIEDANSTRPLGT